MVVWRSGEQATFASRQDDAAPSAGGGRLGRPGRWGIARGIVLALALMLGPQARGEGDASAYWLNFGKTPRLCPGARADSPFKIEGASWGILASGVILCRDLGASYAISVDYLNVAVDPVDRALIKRDVVGFDWLGLALYRPGIGGSIDWLFDHSVPVRGELRRNASGRIVFGKMTFEVPKQTADGATNMLFYLTFDGPLVALYVL